MSDKATEKLIQVLKDRLFPGTPSFRLVGRAGVGTPSGKLADYVFGLPGEQVGPAQIFSLLRWGGQFVYMTNNLREMEAIRANFNPQTGFMIDEEEGRYKKGMFAKKWFYFVARKVLLIPPGETTDRFTFSVRLVRSPDGQAGYVVLKEVPSYNVIFRRLRERAPQVGTDVLAKRAKKLVERVFPVFLTREAAFLSLLQRDLPSPHNKRVPSVVGVEKGSDGLVHKLYVEWLRLGCNPLPHLEFAYQSADMLRALHDIVGVIHLDLRLDNFVITHDGVGFIDFGSAVRVNENLNESPMLRSLFGEMMSTSTIQQRLGQMIKTGKVTSSYISSAHQKVDKAIDLFYLAVQMRFPLSNPDFEGLVQFNKDSEAARYLAGLTAAVLRPRDPNNAKYTSAADLLRGIDHIRQKMKG